MRSIFPSAAVTSRKYALLSSIRAQGFGIGSFESVQPGPADLFLIAEGEAYIELALDPEVRRIVLLDGPAFLGDPATWPSQNACLAVTEQAVAKLIAEGVMQTVNVEAASRLLSGAAFNAALWVSSSETPHNALPQAIAAFRLMAEGLLAKRG